MQIGEEKHQSGTRRVTLPSGSRTRGGAGGVDLGAAGSIISRLQEDDFHYLSEGLFAEDR